MDDETRRLLHRLPVHPGLCAACENLRLLASPRSVFVRCGLAESELAFVRYPPLPVRACPGYKEEKDPRDLRDVKDSKDEDRGL